jgi:flagellar assembly factor FliW
MDVQTSRFGTLSVDEQRILFFAQGLLGFPNHKRFALIQTGPEQCVFWLQCVDEPNLAFVVADPKLFFRDYDVPIRPETKTELDMADERFAQVMVICNKVDHWLTGNLLGPLVINAANCLGQQVVLTEKKWTARQPLLRLDAQMQLAKAG